MTKSKVLVLGTFHFSQEDNQDALQGSDLQKQFYIEKDFVELVNYLKRFKTTKIVVEVNNDFQDELHHQYVRFLQGEYDLQKYEVDQIAFRLAKECRLETVYAVDWNESLDIVPNLGELKTNKSKNENEDFGFKDWKKMTNPDVFQITYNNESVTIERIWEK